MLLLRGTLKPEHLTPGIIGVLAGLAGILVGLLVLRRISARALRLTVMIVLLAIGARCLALAFLHPLP